MGWIIAIFVTTFLLLPQIYVLYWYWIYQMIKKIIKALKP